MNSTISISRLVAAGLCAALLWACDSIKDVREQPSTAIPPQQAVLEGKVVGLGTARPVGLSYNGTQNCLAPDPANPSAQLPTHCKFYGTAGQAETGFTFGSLDVGTPYQITVEIQPFGKVCTVANASGTVGGGTTPPVVTCENDDAVSRHNLTVNIAPALQTLSNLKITLATEDQVNSQDATGLASVVFPDALLNSQTNLPAFAFKVTATTDVTVDGMTTSNYCTFTPNAASFTLGGENKTTPAAADTPEATVVPTGPVSVTVNACSFAPSATVQYNGTPAQTMPAGGMTLALRNHLTGEDVQTLEVNAFTAGAATVSFAPVMANPKAIYELVVTRHPAGQHCIVSGSTVVNADTTSATAKSLRNITAPTAGAVLLVDPAVSDWWAYASRAVRCRAIPAAPGRLTGTYQMDRRTPDVPTDAVPNPPFTNPGRGREFLTFFEDGTFLYGINFNAASLTNTFPNPTFPASAALRNNAFASSGVTHGFYNYNSAAGTIAFTVLTATNINPAGRGITGMPGYPAAVSGNTTIPGTVTATNVVKGAAPGSTLSLTFSSTSGSPAVTTTRLWTMTEPESIPGELTGTWVTPDHRRMFAYNKGETFAFHIGVNGMGNLQDVCMIVIDGSTQSEGIITKHAGSSSNSSFQYTCAPGASNIPVSIFAAYNTRTPDLPHYAAKNSTPSSLSGPTTPRVVPGFIGRFPGAGSQLDNRPNSPAQFSVTPGVSGEPDTLTVQATLNGVPINQPVIFLRERAN